LRKNVILTRQNEESEMLSLINLSTVGKSLFKNSSGFSGVAGLAASTFDFGVRFVMGVFSLMSQLILNPI
jgi:hypothetical protein